MESVRGEDTFKFANIVSVDKFHAIRPFWVHGFCRHNISRWTASFFCEAGSGYEMKIAKNMMTT